MKNTLEFDLRNMMAETKEMQTTLQETKIFIKALYSNYFEKNEGPIKIKLNGKVSGKSLSEFYNPNYFNDEVIQGLRHRSSL